LKNFNAVLAFFVLFVLVFSFGCLQTQENSTGVSKVSVTIISDTNEVWFSGSSDFNKGLNAFDAMKQLLGEQNISYDSYDFGVFVKGFMGRETPNDYFWSLSVNGSSADKGISSYSLDYDTNFSWELKKLESYPN